VKNGWNIAKGGSLPRKKPNRHRTWEESKEKRDPNPARWEKILRGRDKIDALLQQVGCRL